MIKTANVGSVDRIIRIVIGALLVLAPYFYTAPIWDNQILRWLVPLVGLVLIATAFLRFCPLYRLIGMNTCKVK
jgi:hypothetical protein